MTIMNRRDILRRAALLGGAFALPSGLLLSTTGCTNEGRRTPHYFIFYFMMGGWDLVLTTDPVPSRGDTIWVPYEDEEIIESGGHRFGPAFKPLLPWASRMAVLRGIYCDALNHPQARFRMCTGQFRERGGQSGRPGAPSIQAILGEQLGQGYEIPNLSADSIRPGTFRGDNQDLRYEPVRIASVNQLKDLVNWRHDAVKERADVMRAIDAIDTDTVAQTGFNGVPHPLVKEFGAQAKLARETLGSSYASRVSAMEKGTFDQKNRALVTSQLAVEVIKNDVAPVVTCGSGEFDMHTSSQYRGAMTAAMRGSNAIASMCAGLSAVPTEDGRTLLDRTTIVVTSEFSRDPTKNELGGKHHWPANSMIVIGKGVPRRKDGPLVVGETDDGLNPEPMNPLTGRKKRAQEIEMTNALATLLAMAGIDPVPFFGGYEPIVPMLS